MAPGQRLPAEPVLARAYGVNRLTVREALTTFARQGLVRRVQGVGSFVAEAPVRHRVDAGLASLTDALRVQGSIVPEDVLEATPAPAEAVPGGPFAAFPGPVTILWSRRVVQDAPWSLSLTWLPTALLGQKPVFEQGLSCRRCSPSAMVCAPSRPTAWSPRRRPRRRTANISTSRRVHR